MLQWFLFAFTYCTLFEWFVTCYTGKTDEKSQKKKKQKNGTTIFAKYFVHLL